MAGNLQNVNQILDRLGYEFVETFTGKGQDSGAFGVVRKVRKIGTEDLYAAKSLHEHWMERDDIRNLGKRIRPKALPLRGKWSIRFDRCGFL